VLNLYFLLHTAYFIVIFTQFGKTERNRYKTPILVLFNDSFNCVKNGEKMNNKHGTLLKVTVITCLNTLYQHSHEGTALKKSELKPMSPVNTCTVNASTQRP
jgi:hypothetical protein